MHKLLATSLLAFVLTGGLVQEENSVMSVDSDVIGPFKAFQDDETISFSYSLRYIPNSVYEELKISNAKTGRGFSLETKASHALSGKKGEVMFNLPLRNFFGKDGFRLSFSIYIDGVLSNTSHAYIYPIDSRTVNVTKDKIDGLVSSNVSFQFVGKKVVSFYDNFNFIGFKDYIDAENYSFIDLKSNTFLYNNTLEYSSAELYIYDPEKKFQYLKHDRGNNVIFPLTLNNELEIKNFVLGRNYYVNPYNLQTLTIKSLDTIQTNLIYLPINSKSSFLGSNMKIVLNDCGLNKYKLIFDITYDVSRNLVGNCSDSDYCVKGKVE
ncbi:MAG: hypothetical protein K6E21_01465 [Bacilli bacterium]|nr:hypothetical protein [Bacilli bacterium]